MPWSRGVVPWVGIVMFAVVASAGCSSSPNRSDATTTPRAVSVTIGTTSVSPTTFAIDHAGLTAAYVPSGFVAVKTTRGKAVPGHVSGPAPGWTNDGQRFWNATTKQLFIMSVSRGQPSDPNLSAIVPRYMRCPHRVSGHDTYVRTERLAEPEREFAWTLDSTTGGFLGGFRMTDDELLRIANGIRITH